ncbi:MAG TPA: hypothetical protein PK544_09485 [Spirochaetota bacterium]|nr:hypothetical protein [Spirochaetota bacterium]HPQ53904.1 hypothetical protein [Spirochaetota bacterium]
MSEKILQGIQEAEKKAAEILYLAETESQAVIKEIHVKYRARIDTFENSIKQERDEVLKKAAADSMNTRDHELHQRDITDIKAAAEGNSEKAITQLIKFFLE